MSVRAGFAPVLVIACTLLARAPCFTAITLDSQSTRAATSSSSCLCPCCAPVSMPYQIKLLHRPGPLGDTALCSALQASSIHQSHTRFQETQTLVQGPCYATFAIQCSPRTQGKTVPGGSMPFPPGPVLMVLRLWATHVATLLRSIPLAATLVARAGMHRTCMLMSSRYRGASGHSNKTRAGT